MVDHKLTVIVEQNGKIISKDEITYVLEAELENRDHPKIKIIDKHTAIEV